ncbi:putative acetyltransferase (plasmid) [Sinorhizobium fredii NGR234]|uniref:Acetyltransferase n=1 Tax=Sinorhizobium fredii (strain NBRC 101917 / NGR234) TaxID=394 RepID=C3KKN9_SINFN|nr:GNAT family N-acetyltransferase [Sinorhizobium fredii]ACP22975.1 putative acetyltransferase [Sinorhizobium fredii NGR234]
MEFSTSQPVQLGREFADEAAGVLRVAFDDRLPSLAGLHTPEEDSWFFRNRVFQDCSVWGVFERDVLVGMIAFRPEWIDQLYVLPAHQGRGIGASLLNVARTGAAQLSLWTFQCNRGARRFYEKHGFIAVEETDGSRNEEKEPDVLYRWVAE